MRLRSFLYAEQRSEINSDPIFYEHLEFINPKTGTRKMKAKIKQISGISMAAISDSNHWITLDGPLEFGGASAGCRPMELILMGLAGCTAMDVVSILMKKRVKLTDFSLEVEANRAKDHPKVFTEVKLHFIFTSQELKPADIERAISLSQEKYCAATAMLKKSRNITHDYEIIESSDTSV